MSTIGHLINIMEDEFLSRNWYTDVGLSLWIDSKPVQQEEQTLTIKEVACIFFIKLFISLHVWQPKDNLQGFLSFPHVSPWIELKSSGFSTSDWPKITDTLKAFIKNPNSLIIPEWKDMTNNRIYMTQSKHNISKCEHYILC